MPILLFTHADISSLKSFEHEMTQEWFSVLPDPAQLHFHWMAYTDDGFEGYREHESGHGSTCEAWPRESS